MPVGNWTAGTQLCFSERVHACLAGRVLFTMVC